MHPLHLFHYCPCCGSEQFLPQDEKSKRCVACGFEYYLNPSSAYVALITDDQGRLLVERRGREPAKGTLDLPGGFADMHERAEDGVAREVFEETGLTVTRSRYLFSLPNNYLYAGLDIPTLDLFFLCEVKDTTSLLAGDDADACFWLPLSEINPADFGLHSISRGVAFFLASHGISNTTDNHSFL